MLRNDRRPDTRASLRALVLAVVAALTISLGAAAPAAATVPDLTNPGFTDQDGDGLPDGWGVWRAAGSATVAVDPAGGPDGGSAVAITSESGADARLALTQRVPIGPDAPRELTVSAQVRGTELAGGFSMLRVQAYDAAGDVVVPVARGPYLTGTFDWRAHESRIELPPEAVELSVEPMLDRTSGTVAFADVQIRETAEVATLSATATPAGPVELSWTLADDETAAASFRVHRAEGTGAPDPSPETFLREAQALTTADRTAAPGTTYTYVVTAHAADGSMVATTRAATTTTPPEFTSQQAIATLTALATGDGAHVAWSLPAGSAAAGLTLATDTAREAVSGGEGAVLLDARPGEQVRLLSGDTVLATAEVGDSAHPRSLGDEAIAEVRAHLEAGEPTVTGAWEALLDRLEEGDSAYGRTDGSAGLYRGRDAAFAYLVTGDERWAQVAFEATMSAADFVVPRDTNMGLELGRANLNLAPIYDWAYQGWTPQQREQMRALMTRAAVLLSTYHHDNLDADEKTSNWIGVTRTPELQLLLAARGDGDFGMYDERIAYLTDQVAQHLDQGYTAQGHTQEGWDYLHYTGLYMLPAIYFAQGTGLQVLDEHVQRPQWPNLALHVLSSRPDGDVAQFGVAGPSGQVDGILPLLAPLADEGELPGLRHLYDHVQGLDHPQPELDGVHSLWTMLLYPTAASSDPADLTAPAAHRALLDDESGFYAFRSQYEDTDDTLLVTSNRNSQHRGWSAAETFSLSWMSHGTTWGLLGGRASTEPNLWSKPLVDGKLEPYRNQYETVTGDGETLASVAFENQGGGYLHLDGSGNFGVDRALREQVVDLAPGHRADAIVAIRDQFADAESHTWDWQLRPESGVAIEIPDDTAEGRPDFTFTGEDGAVLSGFVLGQEPSSIVEDDGTLRISQQGDSAEFRIVLATSASGPLELTEGLGETVVLDDRVIDFDHLGTGEPLPAAAPVCDDTITGTHHGPLRVSDGVTCLEDATVRGPVSVTDAAGLVAADSELFGPVTTEGASAVEISGTEVRGPVRIAGTTGAVEVVDNQIHGPLSLTGSDTALAPLVAGNTVTGPLRCTGNSPAPTHDGVANTVRGPSQGQCASLAE